MNLKESWEEDVGAFKREKGKVEMQLYHNLKIFKNKKKCLLYKSLKKQWQQQKPSRSVLSAVNFTETPARSWSFHVLHTTAQFIFFKHPLLISHFCSWNLGSKIFSDLPHS